MSPLPLAGEAGARSVSRIALALARRMRASLGPFALRRQRPRCPQGRRDGSRRFRCQHTDVLSAEHRRL